jgi:flagellar biosynthetic protein FlhB
MADNDQSQEKNLDPTQKRLDKAKEDGEILTSKEMFVFGSSFMGLIVIFTLGMFSKGILSGWGSLFAWDHAENLEVLRIYNAELAFNIFLLGAALFAIPIFAAVIFTQFVVGGSINFSSKALAPKANKINPLSGLKRIFSMKGLVELIKSIAKIVFLVSIAITIIWFLMPKIIYLSSSSLSDAIIIVYEALMLLVGSLIGILFVVGIGDYLYSRHSWLQKLKMSRQDQKDESKDSDGSPEVKARMRRLQMAASQKASERSQAVDDVKDASVIITNPTHFAIALRYAPEERDAPYILAMGRGHMALKIIDEGEKHSKSVVRSPLLARALFFTGDIGHDVSEQLFSAVASVLAYVLQIERGVEASLVDPELPDELMYDEFGQKL